MVNFNFDIKYLVNGKLFQDTNLATAHYNIESFIKSNKLLLSIKTAIPIEIVDISISFKKDYLEDELFFANGYQSWTKSKEYNIKSKQVGIPKFANISERLRKLAGISGDTMFSTYTYKPGSFHSFTYCYFRQKGSNNITLYGSINEKTGFTIFSREMQNNYFAIKKDLEGLTINGTYELFNIERIEGSYDAVFDSYFKIYGVKKPRLTKLNGYTSWYNYFQKIDENIILRDLEGLAKIKNKAQIFQIDDGYETFVGDWLDPNPDKFPHGMEDIASKIHKKGFLAGLWLAPLNAQRKSNLTKTHPDWLIKDNKTNKPLLGVVAWGGAYTLDIYNEEVRDHLRNVFDTVLNKWSFDLLKLDFLYSECIQPRLNKTRGTIMCETMEFLREITGNKFILGCGVPLGSAFNYVDACRTGCDADIVYNGKYYNNIIGDVNPEIISTKNSITNTIFRRHLNGRAFLSDPDVFFLRYDNLKYTEEQKILLAKINKLFGGILFVSDNVGDYNENQLNLLNEIFHSTTILINSVEFLNDDVIDILYEENSIKKQFTFNLKTGNILKSDTI